MSNIVEEKESEIRLQNLLRKIARASGNYYVNIKGKKVLPKQIGPDCKCKKLCFLRINEYERKSLFDYYYNLADYELQTKYLANCITNEDIKVRYGNGLKVRNKTTKYEVLVNGNKPTTICRKAFTSIFGLSNRRVSVIREKADIDQYEDGRGKRGKAEHNQENVTDEVAVEKILIKKEIKSEEESSNEAEVMDHFLANLQLNKRCTARQANAIKTEIDVPGILSHEGESHVEKKNKSQVERRDNGPAVQPIETSEALSSKRKKKNKNRDKKKEDVASSPSNAVLESENLHYEVLKPLSNEDNATKRKKEKDLAKIQKNTLIEGKKKGKLEEQDLVTPIIDVNSYATRKKKKKRRRKKKKKAGEVQKEDSVANSSKVDEVLQCKVLPEDGLKQLEQEGKPSKKRKRKRRQSGNNSTDDQVFRQVKKKKTQRNCQ